MRETYTAGLMLSLLLLAAGCGDPDETSLDNCGDSQRCDAATCSDDCPDTGTPVDQGSSEMSDTHLRPNNDQRTTPCEPAAVICNETNDARLTCMQDGNWGVPEPCETTEICENGECLPISVHWAQQCVSTVVYLCETSDNGPELQPAQDCADEGLSCADGRCFDAIEASRGQTCNTIECLSTRTTGFVCGRVTRTVSRRIQHPFRPAICNATLEHYRPWALDHALKMVNLGRWLTGLPEVNGSEALHSALSLRDYHGKSTLTESQPTNKLGMLYPCREPTQPARATFI